MTWYAHIKRNERIVELLKDGLSPKEIKHQLHLTNVHVVYRVIYKVNVPRRAFRKKAQNRNGSKTRDT